MIRLAVVLLALALAGCGGGSGGGSFGGGGASGSFDTPPTPRTSPLRFGYFGIDGDQLRETAGHVSFALVPDWGDWNTPGYDAFRIPTAIMQLQEAKARGVTEAWVMVGFLVLSQQPGCTEMCVSIRPDGIARLQAFKAQLDALGLTDMVTALYPIDEPESHGMSDAQLVTLLKSLKAAWPGPKMAVIYSSNPHGYPGLSEYDLAGRDDYDAGVNALDNVPPVKGAQQLLIIPGGANPWHADPQPFYDYAMAHGNVYAIVPFVWFDRGTDKGIRDNGLAATYTQIGCKVTGKC